MGRRVYARKDLDSDGRSELSHFKEVRLQPFS